MSVVSIFSGVFCAGRAVAGEVAKGLNCPLVDDALLLSRIAWRARAPQAPPAADLLADPASFARFPRERDRLLAELRLGLAELLEQENLVYLGYGAHLIPPSVSHALSVCLIADQRHRLGRALEVAGLDQAGAEARIRQEDQRAQRWVELLHGREAWSSDLYDILIPMDKQDQGQAVKLILEHARSALLLPTADSLSAVRDFRLAARLEAVLADQGPEAGPLKAEVSMGRAVITAPARDDGQAPSEQDEREIFALASRVEGVDPANLEVMVGAQPAQDQAETVWRMPSKVFLVDDEREFVQTLSDRLLMRQVNSVVAFNGEEALRLAREDEPEVVILDLRMPGLDGTEVLRLLKQEHPGLEVIILTGHGSDKDRALCLELGAFAFLSKPLDMETLQRTLQAAYEKIEARRG